MKNFFVRILTYKLRFLARWTISRYRPGVIGVTGSVGKTSAKRAIAAVLASERKVRVSKGNLNNEIGIALTVLGDWKEEEWKLVTRAHAPGKNAFRKFFFWCKVIWTSLYHLVFSRKGDYPEILILEYGVDRPGDMRRLLDIVSPNISIITAVGEIPVHVEFFSGPEGVAREKAKLIDYLPTAGFAILNHDDGAVINMKNRTRAHVMTFGFGRGAEVRVLNFENRSEAGKPTGVAFKLQHIGGTVPVRIDGVFGKSQAYAASAAACVGLIFGMNLSKIASALKEYRPAHGRMELVPGIKYSYIIDDSYNASPLSMHAALDTLKSLPAKRRIAVLGDMLEIGQYSIEAHEHLGRLAAEIADVLITVGPRAKFIAESAHEKGMRKGNILSFERAKEAQIPVQNLIKKGDLILVKGSRAMGLEKIVEEIKAF